MRCSFSGDRLWLIDSASSTSAGAQSARAQSPSPCSVSSVGFRFSSVFFCAPVSFHSDPTFSGRIFISRATAFPAERTKSGETGSSAPHLGVPTNVASLCALSLRSSSSPTRTLLPKPLYSHNGRDAREHVKGAPTATHLESSPRRCSSSSSPSLDSAPNTASSSSPLYSTSLPSSLPPPHALPSPRSLCDRR